MSLLNWSDDLSVGVRAMDDQHKVLVNLINELHEAMRTGQGQDAMAKIVTGLKEYTQKHFVEEEAHMERFKSPDLQEQRREHNQFVKKILDLELDVREGKLGTSMQAMTYMKTWLTGHIAGKDKKYAPLFNANGMN